MKKSTENLLKFLQGNAVVKITSEKEFKSFLSILADHKVEDIFSDKYKKWSDWVKLAKINCNNPALFLFEFTKMSLTWSDNEEKSIEWYGCPPLCVRDLTD